MPEAFDFKRSSGKGMRVRLRLGVNRCSDFEPFSSPCRVVPTLLFDLKPGMGVRRRELATSGPLIQTEAQHFQKHLWRTDGCCVAKPCPQDLKVRLQFEMASEAHRAEAESLLEQIQDRCTEDQDLPPGEALGVPN